jgi:hypothetical protein
LAIAGYITTNPNVTGTFLFTRAAAPFLAGNRHRREAFNYRAINNQAEIQKLRRALGEARQVLIEIKRAVVTDTTKVLGPLRVAGRL